MTTIFEDDKIKITVQPDEWYSNPLEDMDTLWSYALHHPDYKLSNLLEMEFDKYSREEQIRYFTSHYGEDCLIVPLYFYEHSQVAIVLNSGAWDYRFCGYAILPKSKLASEYVGIPYTEAREIAMQVLQGELDMYNAYLNGECWEFVVSEKAVCPCCNHTTYTILESEGQFLTEDQAVQAAKEYQEAHK